MIDFIVHRSTDLVHEYGRRIWSTSAKLYIDLRADRIGPRVGRFVLLVDQIGRWIDYSLVRISTDFHTNNILPFMVWLCTSKSTDFGILFLI